MTAAPSSLGTQFREELSCSICLELFTRPKVLPCQHTFCQDCLLDHAGRGGAFQCPNCRLNFELPLQGVAGLQDNHLVTNLCERLQKQATQSGNRCSFHPSEVLKVYCKQCNMPVCIECLDEVHSDHETISLKKATEERRATFHALINEGKNILQVYSGFLKSLREKEKTLDDQKQETDNSIIHAYSQEVQKAAEKRDHLLFQEKEKFKNNKGLVQEERDRVLADVDELSAAFDQLEQALGGADSLCQETILTEVVEKYRGKLQNAAPVQPQPAAQDVQPQPVQPPPAVQPRPVQPRPVQPQPVQHQPAVFPKVTLVTAAGILLLAVLLYSPLYRLTVQPLSKTITFGGKGSENGQFKGPSGVAVSEEGEIFVADRWNQRIQVFTLQGTFVRQFPTFVSGEEEMELHDVAMDGEGNLWVVGHTGFAEVAVQYTKQGRVLSKFDLQKTGRHRGVAVDTRRNHILITQTIGDWPDLQGEVQVFRPDGTLVRTAGQQQGMEYPTDITLDREGNILVSDYYSDYVYVYSKDGQFLFKFGGKGSGEGQLQSLNGICTDRVGNIIVADWVKGCVEMFDKTGRFLKHIATDMMEPQAVAMATHGHLVVTDTEIDVIHIIPSCIIYSSHDQC